jgi:hypothetical protein
MNGLIGDIVLERLNQGLRRLSGAALIAGFLVTFSGSAKAQFDFGSFDASSMGDSMLNSQIVQNYVKGLQAMNTELDSIMMKHSEIIGGFFDAKRQLETQQVFQKLAAEAHKDYHPSEMMCQYGTFTRSIARGESQAEFSKATLNRMLMAAYTNNVNMAAASGKNADMSARVEQFIAHYCDPADNANGLNQMCSAGGNGEDRDKSRFNKDIDYARTLAAPMTLAVDYGDDALSDDETDVLALGRHLYWDETLRSIEPQMAARYPSYYARARSFIAKHNVAHNSFIEIAGLKSEVKPEDPETMGGGAFIKALLRDFDISDEDITAQMGEYPSYYAQMEVLTKKMYQNPQFYTNLYDKPANVDRITASMKAIELMQGRDHYESLLRREMLLSQMVEQELQKHIDITDANL